MEDDNEKDEVTVSFLVCVTIEINQKDGYKMTIEQIGNVNGNVAKSWIRKESIEPSAINQIENLISLPFIYPHVAIMPDCHAGYGMPIGAVLPTIDVIIPNAVGVDIGCGMYAAKTSLKHIDEEKLKRILSHVRLEIPTGFSRRKPVDLNAMPEVAFECYIAKEEFENARSQIGTLGGGNHFIEFQKGSDGHVWFMIHSGSRNLGKKVCDFYNESAKQLDDLSRSGINIPKEYQLDFLPIGHKLARQYLADMNYCLEFARENRIMMSNIIRFVMNDITGCHFIDCFDVHHNYVCLENHEGKDVYVHRKGATSAKKNEIGIIPGSQGSKSYIVEGKGNKDSLNSCSHGAGRKMSRTLARKNLNIEEEKRKLEELGVIHAIRNEKDLDESPGAYKDIREVIDNQSDLIDVVIELSPIAVIKG